MAKSNRYTDPIKRDLQTAQARERSLNAEIEIVRQLRNAAGQSGLSARSTTATTTATTPSPSVQRPIWNLEEMTLVFRGHVKRYRKLAKNQFALFAVFQAANWPLTSIADPFTCGQLGASVRDVNGSLVKAGLPIRFIRDGKGGVRWTAI
jgi:hypothetical protein